ncbi:MAG TPA: hypothetical protein VJ204_13195 [Solirubrobacterales bacterium]|nr:hypothetical protein [Solirubrobacterales bacterium]
MSDTVRDDDLLGRMRLADPVDLAELERAVAPLRDRIKARAIAQGNTPTEPIPAGDRAALEGGSRGERGRSRGRRRWLPLGFASLTGAAVLAVVLIFSGSSLDSGPGANPGFADAAVKVAEANPRLLITAPGWRIEEARSFKPQRGQLELGDGTHRVHLAWGPAAERREDLHGYGRDGRVTGNWTATIAGRTADVFHLHAGPTGSYFTTIFPAEGGVYVYLAGEFAKRSEWEKLMTSVRAVGVDEWLEAMPGDILRPQAFKAELARMLHGVPVPPGFEATATIKPTELTNRFQAAKKLTQAVTCEWVRRWAGARKARDTAGAREAVAAISGARDWPVLLRMAREKGYQGDSLPAPGFGWPTSIITIGRQMAAGRLRRERGMADIGGKVTAVGFAIPQSAYPPDRVRCSSSGGSAG